MILRKNSELLKTLGIFILFGGIYILYQWLESKKFQVKEDFQDAQNEDLFETADKYKQVVVSGIEEADALSLESKSKIIQAKIVPVENYEYYIVARDTKNRVIIISKAIGANEHTENIIKAGGELSNPARLSGYVAAYKDKFIIGTNDDKEVLFLEQPYEEPVWKRLPGDFEKVSVGYDGSIYALKRVSETDKYVRADIYKWSSSSPNDPNGFWGDANGAPGVFKVNVGDAGLIDIDVRYSKKAGRHTEMYGTNYNWASFKTTKIIFGEK